MYEIRPADPDRFRRVWQRVMPADRPDCPFALDPPFPCPVCLGEDSAGDLAALARLLCLTEESRLTYRALGRRVGLARRLHAAKEGQKGRLSAAYFLIAGEPCDLPSSGLTPRADSLPLALRACYRREQGAALRFLSAADLLRDPCLCDLCREMGEEDRAHAAQLRALLEQIR